MANQVALLGGIKILADGVKDIEKALEPGQTLIQRVSDFSNLVQDAIDEAKVIGDIKAEVASLTPADYVSLAGVLVSDLAVSNAKAQAIVQASLKLLSDGVANLLPDAEALIAAVKS